MRNGFIKVAAASPEIRVADTGFNAGAIIKIIEKAAKLGVKLIAFPELCVTGYTCGDLFFQEKLLSGAGAALERILSETSGKDILAIIGAPERKNGKLYNSAYVIKGGEVIGIVRKQNLPNYNEFYELRQFVPGERESVVFVCRDLPEFTFGVEICEDLWTVSPPSNVLAVCGANIIVNISASNELTGKSAYRRSLVAGQSARTISRSVRSRRRCSR